MKHTQQGFSAVEVILVVIVLGILGAGGWYVVQKGKDKTNDAKTSVTDQANDNQKGSSADNEPADSTKLTTKLTSHHQLFSLHLPDGWKFTNDTELDYAHAIGLDKITYRAGTPATVLSELGHRGGGVNAASLMIQSGTTANLGNYFSASETQGSLKTNDGLEGTKYLFTAKEGDETLTAGTKSFGYKFSKGDKTVVITYLQLPGDPDQLQVVEDAIKTFTFL